MASRINIHPSASRIYRGRAAVEHRGARGNATASTVRMGDYYKTAKKSRFGDLETTKTGQIKSGSGKS